jgi:hypothetical protein
MCEIYLNDFLDDLAGKYHLRKIEFYTYFPNKDLTLRFVDGSGTEFLYTVGHEELTETMLANKNTYCADCYYLSKEAISAAVEDGVQYNGL